MKKVLQVVATLGFSFIALTGAASAQQNCTIDNTGPSSVNVCVNTETVTCNINNNNVITINGTNYQGAQSGDAIVVNNTNAGGAGSGSANNNNSSSVNITVTNPNYEEPENNTCVVVTTTRTPVETPVAGGSGGGESAAPVAVTNLPKTSGTSPLTVASIVAAASAVAAVIFRGASFAYGRIKG